MKKTLWASALRGSGGLFFYGAQNVFSPSRGTLCTASGMKKTLWASVSNSPGSLIYKFNL
ncbi:MAG: hypothetical protein PUG93_06670 [Oscillospiraceae bacterium]|nr:hypothetical protein [Oscillospiraceae bacterium]MDD7354799.1 hypothetical protein [Oscillospiraceae bacterium]